MSYFKSKNGNWNIIKKYYPKYESKQVIIESLIKSYLKRNMILLDVGCGRGKETAISYKDEVDLSFGLDISENVRFNNTIHYPIVADACKLPFADLSIDLIISQELIEHLKDPAKYFREIHRVLKPDGIFICATPNLLSWKSIISLITPYRLHVKLNKQLHGINASDVFPTYYRMNRINKINRLMNRNNMYMEKNIMWEGTPRTLTFNRLTTYLDIIITTILRKYESFKNYRELIIGSYRKIK